MLLGCHLRSTTESSSGLGGGGGGSTFFYTLFHDFCQYHRFAWT